jgi:hypothetical protein
MIVAIAVAAVGTFVVAFSVLRVAHAAAGAVTMTKGAIALLSDSAMDDETRERAARRASGRLFLMAGSVALRGTLAAVIALLPVLAAERVGIVAFDDVVAFLSRWDVVLGASVLVLLGYLVEAKKSTRWRST